MIGSSRKLSVSKLEVGTQHWLSSVRKRSRRTKRGGQIGSLVQVPSILPADAQVWQQTPIQARPVNKQRLGVDGGARLSTDWNVKQEPHSHQRKWAQIRYFQRRHPIARHLMCVGQHRNLLAKRVEWAGATCVGLIAAIE